MAAPTSVTELLIALKAAPQDKEGAFRVGTWKMVLQAISDMQNDIADLESKLGIVSKATVTAPDAAAIKKSIQDDLSKADSNKVLF